MPSASAAPFPVPPPATATGLPRWKFTTWAVLLALGPLAEIASFFLVPRGLNRLYILNAGQTFASLIAWLVLRRAAEAVARRHPETRTAGQLFTFGALCWAIGNGVFMVQELSLGFAPFPSWYDLCFVAAYAGFGASLLRLPRPVERRAVARTDHRIELAALLLVTSLAAWEFKLHDYFAAVYREPTLETGYPLLYPILDIALLWVLFRRVLHQDHERLPLLPVFLLIFALFSLVAADFALPDLIFDASKSSTGAGESSWSLATEKLVVSTENTGGSSWTSIGWGCFSSLLGLAALAQLRALAVAEGRPLRPRVVPRALVILLVTYVWIAVMLLLLLRGLFVPGAIHSPWLISAGVLLLLTLVVIRQVREVLSNEHLNRQVRELAESREHFRRLFQLFPDAVVLGHVDTGQMMEVNEGFSRLFGYSYAECVGRSTLDLNLWESPSSRVDFVAELRRAGRVMQREWTARRRDGTVIPLEMNARLVTIAGQEYILNLVRDLTERKQAEERLRRSEEQLRRAQKLEAIGTLAGGIAHDFNNLLTGIIGNAELTLLDLPPDHPGQAYLESLLAASNTGKEMVRQILTFARRHERQSQVVELGQVLDDVARLLRASAGSGIDIRRDSRSPASRVDGDLAQLHQVFLNLGTNALQAVRDRPAGRLEFIDEPYVPDAAFMASHPALVASGYLRVTVRDNGCGMSPEVLARIFEPFFTTRPHGAGTGLGLAVAHGIIEGHGGTITVESVPGQGSAFHVFLPAADAPATPVAAAPLRYGANQRVLYVDDDPQTASATERMLTRLGYRPIIVLRPEDAVAQLRSAPGPVELIVSDFAMPGLDGVGLYQQLRAAGFGQPFILASGYLSEAELGRARAAGIERFLDKPFTLADLSHAMHAAIAGA
ncbi:MAG TPA: PAS domain S-box protein [Opitutaceae bacterium]|nr:PAS domain S-box protein [Opitutaceae bacterium]